MAGYYTSYNNRRALGMRYSRPPELVLDEERLAQEYAQLPSKRALAEQQRQFNIAQQNQQDAQKQGGISSAIGTVGNIASTYYLGKNMGMWGGKAAAPAVAPQTATAIAPTATTMTTGTTPAALAPSAVDMATATPVATTGMSGAAIPATTDLAALEAASAGGVGAPVGMSTAELGAGAGAEAGATLGGAASAGMAAAPYAVAGYIAAKAGGKLIEKAAGEGSSNVFSQFGRTVQNPLQGIGGPWLNEIIKDEGTKKTVNTVMKVLNPIGAVFDALGF